ncbi:hypothetical protein BV20DRAFT_716004 [Pilatotrama ljubarskyi]|nr:hypothetical protein BV20DRAFT_716004 [Pilatotrama ljubarskyi]
MHAQPPVMRNVTYLFGRRKSSCSVLGRHVHWHYRILSFHRAPATSLDLSVLCGGLARRCRLSHRCLHINLAFERCLRTNGRRNSRTSGRRPAPPEAARIDACFEDCSQDTVAFASHRRPSDASVSGLRIISTARRDSNPVSAEGLLPRLCRGREYHCPSPPFTTSRHASLSSDVLASHLRTCVDMTLLLPRRHSTCLRWRALK